MAHTTTEALHETPIGKTVEALQDAGREIFIAGFSADGGFALVVDLDNEQCSVAAVGTANGLGRWECSTQHRNHHGGFFAERFPLR